MCVEGVCGGGYPGINYCKVQDYLAPFHQYPAGVNGPNRLLVHPRHFPKLNFVVAEDAKLKPCSIRWPIPQCHWQEHTTTSSDDVSHSGSIAGCVSVFVPPANMREIVHIQAGQCGNQIGAKVRQTYTTETDYFFDGLSLFSIHLLSPKNSSARNVCAQGGG